MVNKVILVGNLGKDPEVRHLEGGVAVASFTLATSEKYTNKSGERVSQTEWHNVVLWRGLADIAEKYLRKGSQVYIEGKIRTRSWDDQAGVKKYTTEIIADNMTMLGGANKETSNASPSYQAPTAAPSYANAGSSAPQSQDTMEDDLPF